MSEELNQQLYDACKGRYSVTPDIYQVRRLIGQGADPHWKNPNEVIYLSITYVCTQVSNIFCLLYYLCLLLAFAFYPSLFLFGLLCLDFAIVSPNSIEVGWLKSAICCSFDTLTFTLKLCLCFHISFFDLWIFNRSLTVICLTMKYL